MLKKILTAALAAAAAALTVGAAGYEPYTLCYNTIYAGSHEGIQAGWTLDNRGGPLRTGIQGGYETLTDVSTFRGCSLYRDLNRTDEGVVTLETAFSFKTGFDGLRVSFTDDNGALLYALETDDGAFYVRGAGEARRKLFAASSGGSYRLIVTVDFENGTADTVINDVDYGTDPLLSDNMMRFAFSTTPEDELSVVPSGVKLTANYTLHDDFTYASSSAKQIPYGWTSDNTANAYVSSSYATVKSNAALAKSFDRVSGRQAFEGVFYNEAGAFGLLSLYDGANPAFELFFGEGELVCEGETVYADLLDNFWYRCRAEIDFDAQTVLIKLNGRALAELPLAAAPTGADRFEAVGYDAGIRFDDIKLFELVEQPDYVPEPVLPGDSAGNIVGLNVCSLWAYTSNHGWSCVTPYEEFRPVLGYYDEGSAETADWEIKFLAEHGVDFQAFCWYADYRNAPLKNTRNSIHLHDGFMNARYSDKMKYCIIWEAANGAHPENSSAFRRYFVPYWIENYFKDDRYMTIDNKPLLLVFGINQFIDDMGGAANAKTELDYLRGEVKKLGFDDLIILASNVTDSDTLVNAGLDGCYAYNWGTKGYDVDYSIGRITDCANVGKTYTVPTLSTGFNSLPWHGKRYPNMSVDDYTRGLMWIRDEYFETYPKKTWQERFMMLSTWNEYGEGTYIMPAEKLNGFGYLDAIRSVFTDDDVPHSDVIPNDAQRARITKNYPQHIRLLRRLDREQPDPETTLFERETLTFSGKVGFYVGNVNGASYDGTVGGTSRSSAPASLAYVETRDAAGLDLARADALRLTMSVSSNTEVKVYYTTSDSPYYSKDKCFTFAAAAGGLKDYALYAQNLSGRLEKVRILPADRSGIVFRVASLTTMSGARLIIDEKHMTSSVYPEERDGRIWFPFDPAQAQGYIMNIHFEWDYDAGRLTLYGDEGKWIALTAGSDLAETGEGILTLPGRVYLSDGLPMLPMETVCDALGFTYEYDGRDIHVRTPDYEEHRYVFSRPENEWDFTYNANLGWSGNAVSSVENGTMYVRATDNDPRMMFAGLSLAASKYSDIEVCLSYTNKRAGDNIKFFFITNNDKTWDERKQTHVIYPDSSSGGKFVTFRLNLSGNRYWKDTITSLRFDPFNAVGSECYVKYIKLIPDPDAVERSDVPFERAVFDAENGEMPFVSGNAEIKIVADPSNSANRVYRVTPTPSNTYTQMNYSMHFEPGATYTVSFDVMAGKLFGDTATQTKVTIHADPRYDDPAQYGQQNPDDHVLAAVTPAPMSNSGEWCHAERTFTVNSAGFIRSADEFRIYSNPSSGKSAEFYIDNLVIEKTSGGSPSLTSARLNANGALTVSGSAGKTLAPSSGTTAILAVYDRDGRLLGVQVPDLATSASFTAVFNSVPNAATVRLFLWSGVRTLIPRGESVSLAVTR